MMRKTKDSIRIMMILLTFAAGAPLLRAATKEAKAIVYVGTFKGAEGQGIYAWRFDSNTGTLEPLGLVAAAARPLFLALHPNGRFLYAVSRPSLVDRQQVGAVLSFAVDARTGQLTALNSQSSRGIDPDYLSVDQSGEHLLVANYGSNSGDGSIAIFPIKQDGRLSDATQSIQFSGKGVHPQRQQGAHSHAINASPDNRFVMVADLGLDKLFVYVFDQREGRITPNNPAYASLAPGAGPRHLVFHPGGHYVYVVNEIQSTITTFAYESRPGSLKELQTITTLPKDFTGSSSGAEVQVHPNGKFLYGANRGHDSIAVFAIDQRAGTLSLIEIISTAGKSTANFSIDPTGTWLLAANQASDSLVLFRLDRNTGRLEASGQTVAVATPSCVKFLPVK